MLSVLVILFMTSPEQSYVGLHNMRALYAGANDEALLMNEVQTASIRNVFDSIYGERNQYSETAEKHLQTVRGRINGWFKACGLKSIYQKETGLLEELDTLRELLDVYVTTPRDSFRLTNVIGTKYGTDKPNEFVLLIAHYDTSVGSPGYDDNTTGVAGLIEAMRVLSKHNFSRSIRFIAMDAEESGLWGSYKFSTSVDRAKETIVGVINLDMIGVKLSQAGSQHLPKDFDDAYPIQSDFLSKNEHKGDFVLLTTDAKSGDIVRIMEDVSAKHLQALKVLKIDAGDSRDFIFSDHFPFWLTGTKAVHVGDTGPYRNEFCDTPDDAEAKANVDFAFVTDIVKMTVASVARLASTHEHVTTIIKNKKE